MSDVSSTLDSIRPTAEIALGDGATATDLVVVGGGDAAKVVLVDWGVDVGLLLLWHLPYLLAPLLLALLIWITLRIRRLWRQRSLGRGKPHCRACGYLLLGSTGNDCPECGAVLSPNAIFRPKPVGRRIAGWVALLVVLIFLSTVTWLSGAWYALIPQATGWRSATLGDWAQQYNWQYLGQFVQYQSRIMRIELRDGGERRLVRTVDLRYVQQMVYDPRTPDRALLYDYWGGVTLHEWPGLEQTREWWPQWGMASDYMVELNQQRVSHVRVDGSLVSWKIGQQHRTQTQRQLDQFFNYPRQQWIPRQDRAWLGAFDDHTIVGMHDFRHFKHWRRETGELLNEFSLQGGIGRWFSWSWDADDLIYVSTFDPTTRTPGPIEVWNVDIATLAETIRGPGVEAMGPICVSPGGAYLYAVPVPTTPSRILVRDLSSHQWVAELLTPVDEWPYAIYTSDDGSRVVALSHHTDRGFTLRVFDVPRFADPVPDDGEDEPVKSSTVD